MLNIKLADLAFGKPSVPTKYSSDTRAWIEQDPCEVFLDRLSARTRDRPQPLVLRHVEIPRDASIYHRNYLEYLERCWADHLGIVITPEILWFTVISEIVGVVKEDPEAYRHLFTTSAEKKAITVVTDAPEVMPLGQLVAALRHHVPTDTALFLPDFSTTSARAIHAGYAVFCDLCSPYYNYIMMCCGFPAISVAGEADDWNHLVAKWDLLRPLFEKAGPWVDKVGKTLETCADNLGDPSWWRGIFKLERCGSGHQTEASGWLPDLFRTRPKVPYVENFASHVAKVEYRTLDTQRDFVMQEGLFFSYQEGDFQVPDFGYVVHEKYEGRILLP